MAKKDVWLDDYADGKEQYAIYDAYGGTLHLGSGVRYIRDLVVTQAMNIVGYGPGLSKLFLRPGSNWGLLWLVPGARDSLLQGFTISLEGSLGVGIDFWYGLQRGYLQQVTILNTGQRGTGIALRGVNPSTQVANNNAYNTRFVQCTFEGLWVGLGLLGKLLETTGGMVNDNSLVGCVFGSNALHVLLTDGEMNLVRECDFSEVTLAGAVPRVSILGRYSSTLLVGNYWDNIGSQLAVHQSGFGVDVLRYGLQIWGDNVHSSAFSSDARIDYRGIWY